MDYKDAPTFVRDFLFYMEVVKGRTPLTVENYYTDLRTFIRFLRLRENKQLGKVDFKEIEIAEDDETLIKKVTLRDVQEFLVYMTNEKSNSSKARARKAVVLRQFYKYLTNHKGIFDFNPLANLELPSPKAALPKHLSLEQSIELIKHTTGAEVNHSDVPFKKQRDHCMVVFFLNCGMRLSELTGINRNDVKIDTKNPENSFVKVLGKGNKERIIYLNNLCQNAYHAYIKALDDENIRKRLKGENALFISKQYRRISNRRVQQLINDYMKQIGLDGLGLSVHKLRHTAATLMYQEGVDVRVLKEILGHENLNTTQIYTHVANKQIQNAMSMNPLNINKDDKNKED